MLRWNGEVQAIKKVKRRNRRAIPVPEHKITKECLVRFDCACGYYWRNDELKGKTDYKLDMERAAAFVDHYKRMKEKGL